MPKQHLKAVLDIPSKVLLQSAHPFTPFHMLQGYRCYQIHKRRTPKSNDSGPTMSLQFVSATIPKYLDHLGAKFETKLLGIKLQEPLVRSFRARDNVSQKTHRYSPNMESKL